MTTLGLRADEWINLGIAVVSVVAALTLGRWAINLILKRWILSLVSRTRTTLDDALVESVRPPLYWYLVTVVAQAALNRLDFIPVRYAPAIDNTFFILYVLIGFTFLWRLISRLFQWYGRELAAKTETNLDEQLLPILRRVTLIILGLVVMTMVLQHFNVEISGLVATLGIGSLAIALAAQASLSDIFSGFVIMVDRPFRIGDRIELQDLGTWGDVTDIGLRSTRIRTRDNRMVIIPNSAIGKSLIINHSFPDSHYRIEINVGIGYGSDIEKARQVMIDAAKTVEGIRTQDRIEALFLEMGESDLRFRLRVWIESYVDTRRLLDRVNTAVYTALNDAGVNLPYPQRDVHHHLDTVDPKLAAKLLGRSDSA
jgi:MscS family membrane protein